MAPQKQKGQKMALGDFLQNESLGSWADEMEDAPIPSAPSGRGGYGGDRGYSSGGGFGSGGFDRGYSVREALPLPNKPPYTVHIANMNFRTTEGDIRDFLADCAITDVRIPEDKIEGRPKGFAYATFATLDGLKKALDLSGTSLQDRNIRISVAEPQKERPDARDFGDWARKGPLPDSGTGAPRRTSDRGGFGSGRGFDNTSDAGSDRPGRRAGYEQGDGKVRDFGNWDRKGPLMPNLPAGGAARSFDRPVSRDGPAGRKNSPSWGEGRSDAGSRPPRREFVDRQVVERAPTAAEQDNQWRAKMKPDAPAAPVQPVQATRSPAHSTRELSTPPSPAAAPVAPTSRPKLNLAKRTVSETQTEASFHPGSDSKASPFGAARPVDTATKEKEVDEKRQIALREKKEAEDKARAEKKVADEKAKEEKNLARDAELAARKEHEPENKEGLNGQLKEKMNGQLKEKVKENGASAPPPGKSYEILRRAAKDGSSAAEEEGDEADEDGLVTEDKAIKPKDVVQYIAPKKEESSQTNGAPAAATPEPSADDLDGDGWSTVSKPAKARKTGNQAARAIAS